MQRLRDRHILESIVPLVGIPIGDTSGEDLVSNIAQYALIVEIEYEEGCARDAGVYPSEPREFFTKWNRWHTNLKSLASVRPRDFTLFGITEENKALEIIGYGKEAVEFDCMMQSFDPSTRYLPVLFRRKILQAL